MSEMSERETVLLGAARRAAVLLDIDHRGHFVPTSEIKETFKYLADAIAEYDRDEVRRLSELRRGQS